MGRRTRRRAANPNDGHAQKTARDRQARVKVSEDVWRDFRVSLGDRPVSDELGRLVEREVRRWRVQRAGDSATDAELLAALEAARGLRDDLARMADELDRRTRRESNRG